MKSIPTRRLAGALLVAVVLVGSCLLAAGAAPDPPAGSTQPARTTPAAPPGPAAPAGTLPPAGPATAPQGPPPVLRLSRNIAGDSKPLILNADEFVTWVEKGHRVVLMRGQVLIQQGLIRLRSREAAAFINLDRLQRTGILHADLFADQDVYLEDGRSERRATRAVLSLNTRGELKVLAQRKKVLQQAIPDAPLFQKAVAEIFGVPTGPGTRPGAGSEETSEERRRPAGPIAPPPPPGYAPVPPPAPPPSTIRGVAPEEPPQLLQPVPVPSPAPPAGPPGVAQPPLIPRSPGAPLPPNNPPAPTPPPARPAPAVPGLGAPGPRVLNPPQGVDSPLRQYTVAPRTGATFQLKSEALPNGEQASIFTGGVIISVRGADGSDMLDIEADNALIWTRGGMTREMIENLRRPEGQTSRDVEFYFSGNVQIRQQTSDGMSLLEADEIYLDARRNVAIALSADLQFTRAPKTVPTDRMPVVGPQQPDPFSPLQPVHVRADELRQLAAGKYEAIRAEIFSSKLPSDPGLKVVFSQATVEEVRVPKTTLFGRPIVDRNGNPISELQRPVDGRNARLILGNVPIFYLPRFKGDANDPLGPLENIRLGYNRIYGFETGVTLDVYDLFRLQPVPDSRWTMDVDYLSKRGPGLGTTFDLAALTYFEMPARATYHVRAYGIHDEGKDILGGGRGESPFDNPPDWRGRFLFRQNIQELPEGFVLQAQLAALSDRNFLEQYFKYEFDFDINQETFLYVKQTQGSWAWTGLVEPRLRDWVTETEWLPRLDGHLIGYSFLDRFTYNAHTSAAFAQLKTSEDWLPRVSITDESTSTGRFDFLQEVSLPFYLGPVKLAPYGLADLTYYTHNLDGDGEGRAWGGLGVRASMPLSRLYPDVQSVLWNLNGIMHKVVFRTNYLWAESTQNFYKFPQLDRLNDDATDQALRDIRPFWQERLINPTLGQTLATSPLYDPQVYAIRRLVENRIDTRDDIQVVQVGARQRLQTKRGFPGKQHIIDWMTLDVSASLFPAADRDNFGKAVAFLEYDYLWNIGDRTSLTSSGWFDPIDNGARVWTIGAFFDRPDRTQFYLGYRQIDPLESKAATAAVTYVFSPKYAMTGSATYDFGIDQSLSNSLVFTRLGADINVSLGFTYNSLQNNFGVVFEILPSLLSGRVRSGGAALSSAGGGLGGR